MNVWDAEHVVDEAHARDLLATQMPDRFADLRVEEVEHLADGWDNTVHVVRQQWAVRFPRRGIAVPLFDREVALLPLLAPRLPIAIPVPELIGAPSETFPWPFWGARLLVGTELPEARLTGDRGTLGAHVGTFLSALHDPTLPDELDGPAELLPHDPMRRAQPAVRGPMARACLDHLAARGSWDIGSRDDRAVDVLLATGTALAPPTDVEVLVHGDLNLRHLLVDDSGDAAGVIDWGDMCLADPAVDLSLAYAAFEGDGRASLLSAYGHHVPPERALRARVLAVSLCAALADYADVEGRAALLTEALAGLRRATT